MTDNISPDQLNKNHSQTSAEEVLDQVAGSDFNAQLIAKIKEANIAPKPRWQFLLKNYLVWLSGLLALLVGAAAMSVIIFLLVYNDWSIYDQINHNFSQFIILTLPYFWLIFLGIFIFIIYYNFKHTKKGYRYPLWLIISGSVAASIVLGGLFYSLGWGEKIDNILGGNIPFYEQVINRPVHSWFEPDSGRLAGLIIGLPDANHDFILLDPRRQEWQVNIAGASQAPAMDIVVGLPIRVIGQEVNDHKFRAHRILPVRSGQGFFHRLDRHPAPSNFGPPPINFLSPGSRPMPQP